MQNMNKDYIDKNKVAGIVVLYNPSEIVIESINSYLNQIGHLFIIDNSEKENLFIKNELKEKVSYLFNNSNIGVAAALNLGAKKAIEHGFSFILTMDQDSKAPENMVDMLLSVMVEKKNVGIVSPLHSNKYDTHLRFTEDLEKIDVVMTSGNLVSLEAYEKIGEFNEDFFIDYVDIEYCFKMNVNNYSIYRLNKTILQHDEANLSAKILFNRRYFPHNHKPFRLYYKTRNLLFLRKLYKDKLPDLLKIEYDSYLRTVAKILLFEKQKFLKIKMILIGILDFLKGKKGQRNFS